MQIWRLIRDKGKFFSIVNTLDNGLNSQEIQGQPERAENVGDDRVIQDDGFVGASHPKLAFNFTMEVLFANGETFGSSKMDDMRLAVKSVSRPAPTITYADVNYYNFRTKVATSIDYGTINVEYYDDGQSDAHRMLKTYLNAVSPVSNVSEEYLQTGEGGIAESPFGKYSGIGNLPRILGVIKQIRVYHYFRSLGNSLRTEYVYQNPKVVSFNLGELNMGTNDVTTVGFTFNYDAVYTNDYVLDEEMDNVGELG